MLFKTQAGLEKPQKWAGTRLMNVSAAIVALIGAASLINNIILFKDNVAQYVAQGYPSAEVIKQLIPNQLLPGLFEAIAVYGGIAIILIAAGIINQNLAQCYALLIKDEELDSIGSTEILPDENNDVNVELTE